jgi:hypothetical protein
VAATGVRVSVDALPQLSVTQTVDGVVNQIPHALEGIDQ